MYKKFKNFKVLLGLVAVLLEQYGTKRLFCGALQNRTGTKLGSIDSVEIAFPRLSCQISVLGQIGLSGTQKTEFELKL